jgi:hypothetical protein
MRRVIVLAVVISTLLSFAVAAPVAAAIPANDTVTGAVDVSVGTDVTQITTEATTDGEAGLNDQFCGAPAMEAGVWFEITEPSDVTASFNTDESDYGTGILVFEGDPSDGLALACGPRQVIVSLTGGVTYTLVVFGDGTTATTSGTMILHVREAIPAPEISVTIDPTGRVNKFGQALISGTVTCTSTDGSGTVFEVFGDVSQRVGRFVIRGFFDTFTEIPCDGSTNTWEALVLPDNGLFSGGKAAVVAIAFGCTDECSEGFAEATIRLRRGGTF